MALLEHSQVITFLDTGAIPSSPLTEEEILLNLATHLDVVKDPTAEVTERSNLFDYFCTALIRPTAIGAHLLWRFLQTHLETPLCQKIAADKH